MLLQRSRCVWELSVCRSLEVILSHVAEVCVCEQVCHVIYKGRIVLGVHNIYRPLEAESYWCIPSHYTIVFWKSLKTFSKNPIMNSTSGSKILYTVIPVWILMTKEVVGMSVTLDWQCGLDHFCLQSDQCTFCCFVFLWIHLYANAKISKGDTKQSSPNTWTVSLKVKRMVMGQTTTTTMMMTMMLICLTWAMMRKQRKTQVCKQLLFSLEKQLFCVVGADVDWQWAAATVNIVINDSHCLCLLYIKHWQQSYVCHSHRCQLKNIFS